MKRGPKGAPKGLNYGVPTQLDFLQGFAYATQQINRLKCTDPSIIASVCNATGSGGGNCIQWNSDKQAQIFPTPQNYYNQDCKTDSDCLMGNCDPSTGKCRCVADKDCKQGMNCIQDPESTRNLICGYAPKDTDAGHCVFTNETSCVNQGEMPFICNCQADGSTPGHCETLPKDQLVKSYTEWHTDTPSGTGPPGPPTGKCVLGNFLLRQWCEKPCVRCAKGSDGTYPPECLGGTESNGITTVPQFYYDKNKGACYMTHDYCDAFGMDYNKGSCRTDADCSAGDKCFDSPLGGYCVGPDSECSESLGQKVGEFVVGKTLFYLFNKGGCKTDGNKESFTTDQEDSKSIPKLSSVLKDINEKFNKSPTTACSLVDEKLIRSKTVLTKDFAGPGINLYMITWKSGAVFTGFISSELEKKYKGYIIQRNGDKYICIDRDHLGSDNNLKRIYLTMNSKSWLTELITGLVSKSI